nr:MAG TPA: nucleoside triphosphate pyrophosphohydrolase [Caudoviricetes sp.]
MNIAQGMLENLRELRRLLIEQEREMQRLKIENDWLKMVLSDCEKKRVDAKGGRIVDMTRPQPCVKYMQRYLGEDKSLYLVGRCLAQVDQERKECLEVLTDCFGDKSGAREHLAEELTDVVTAATTALHVLGYDEEARGKLQAQVNAKNRRRGYW